MNLNAQVITMSSSPVNQLNSTLQYYFDTSLVLAAIRPIRLNEFSKPLRAGHIILNLKINDEIFEAKLTETNLIAENYQSNRIHQGVKTPILQKEVKPLEGYLVDQPQSSVRLTIGDDYLYGYLERDGKRFFIEPAARYDSIYKHQYIWYEEGQLLSEFEGSCEVQGPGSDLPKSIDSLGFGSLRRIGNCYVIDLSVLTAPSMNSKFADVHAFVISNMNLVQGLYTNFFADNIQFNIVEQIHLQFNTPAWVADSVSSNLLNGFSGWANTGFQSTNDLGQFWTGIDWVGNSIGLAWVGTVCNPNNRQHVLSATWNTINPTAAALRTLTAHEIGHNFNASHDASGTNIMATNVNAGSPSTTWSIASKNSIDALVTSRARYAPNCMDGCSPNDVPVSQFSAYSTDVCEGSFASYIDLSSNNPDTWLWSFPGATVNTSTQQYSGAQYNSPGQYTVSLKASNAIGEGNTVTKTNYINVLPNSNGTYCIASGAPGIGGITQVNINGTLFNSGLAMEDGSRFLNFACLNAVQLDPINASAVSLPIGSCSANRHEQLRAYIDFNNDGDFSDGGELVLSSNDTFYCGTISRSFAPPMGISLGQKLRFRVILSSSAIITGPCFSPANGQVEDYAVQFGAAALPIRGLSLSASKQSNSSARIRGIISGLRGDEKIELERSKNLLGLRVMDTKLIQEPSLDPYIIEYVDHGLTPGTYYYRLKIKDSDEQVIYSDMIKLELWDQNIYAIYQASTDELIIECKESSDKFVRLINVQGQVLYSIKFIGQSLIIPTRLYAAGAYYLQIIEKGDRTIKKVMKW